MSSSWNVRRRFECVETNWLYGCIRAEIIGNLSVASTPGQTLFGNNVERISESFRISGNSASAYVTVIWPKFSIEVRIFLRDSAYWGRRSLADWH
jgi:hypothetical protein